VRFCAVIDTYEQYGQKLAELKKLQEQIGASDLDQELDEMDVLKCAQMSEFCESLAHSLQIIENPQMRYLLASVSPKMIRQKPRGIRKEGDDPVTFIVAPKLQAGMLKCFQGKYTCLHCTMRLLTFIEKHLKIYSEFQEVSFQPRSQVGFVLVSSTKSVFGRKECLAAKRQGTDAILNLVSLPMFSLFSE